MNIGAVSITGPSAQVLYQPNWQSGSGCCCGRTDTKIVWWILRVVESDLFEKLTEAVCDRCAGQGVESSCFVQRVGRSYFTDEFLVALESMVWAGGWFGVVDSYRAAASKGVSFRLGYCDGDMVCWDGNVAPFKAGELTHPQKPIKSHSECSPQHSLFANSIGGPT